MQPDQIKALRQKLSCSTRELATAVGVDQATVIAWEKGDLFPTKKHCDRMEKLAELGPSAIERPARRAKPQTPMAALADPKLWELIRKLIAHPELRKSTEQLAAAYDDPPTT